MAFTYRPMTVAQLYWFVSSIFCCTVAVVINLMSALFAVRQWWPISSLLLMCICLRSPRLSHGALIVRRPSRYCNIYSISKLAPLQHFFLICNVNRSSLFWISSATTMSATVIRAAFYSSLTVESINTLYGSFPFLFPLKPPRRLYLAGKGLL